MRFMAIGLERLFVRIQPRYTSDMPNLDTVRYLSHFAVMALFVAACDKEPAPTTPPADEPEAPGAAATVTIQGAEGTEVAGTLTLTPTEGGLKVAGKITGLPIGSHGFHIHETGDCSSPDFTSAGGHFNPTDVEHGALGPDTHYGDMGNIAADDIGEVAIDTVVPSVSLNSADTGNVIGRAVIIHAQADDLTSQPSGAAGARIGCGVITTSP